MNAMKQKVLVVFTGLILVFLAACGSRTSTPIPTAALPVVTTPTQAAAPTETPAPAETDMPGAEPSTPAPLASPTNPLPTLDQTDLDGPLVEIVASDLEIPWEVAFLSDGGILVTERTGHLLLLGEDGTRIEIPGVEHRGEGGLLGLALHPDFYVNHYLYLYMTYAEDGELVNRVDRYVYQDQALSDATVILDGIPGAPNHDGGRIAFGPDGLLYITTGDAQNDAAAQDFTLLQGKILRVMDNGMIPESNLFASPVFSYGHRNPQGLTWDAAGRLWSTEHGPSGLSFGQDEVNLVEQGNNYGWPVIRGDQAMEGMISPALQSGTNTWAPGDVQYIDGKLYFTGLRGEALYVATLEDDRIVGLETYFEGEFGRLRAVRLGPDGYLYITTSNRDGRGATQEGDDKLLRINPYRLD